MLNNISISTDPIKQEMSNASDEHADENTAKTLKVDEVESAKAQMSRVREENAKLKMLLEQIETDYKSLQMQFYDIVQQESKKSNSNSTAAGIDNEDIDEHDLVSLRLGRMSPSESKKEDTITSGSSKTTREDEHSKDGLKLGLEYCSFQNSKTNAGEMKNYSSPGNSLNETKEIEAGETWPPSKVLKTRRASGDDELSQPTIKRARVSVRARCDAPTLNDGCQWRKYGQKIAKANPCPRAYYRCTVAPSCPVRKQVQRCAEDTSILITTYEGSHNHQLPISATAMASTTSAAASMLLSGSSSTSQSGFGSSPTTPAINLGGLNVNLFDNLKMRPFYLPNSSVPQLPTITLDLTSSPSTSSTQFNMFSSSLQSSSPRFPLTSLNFSSPESSMLPSVWSNGYLNYATQPYHHKTAIDSPSPFSKQSQELYYEQYMEKNSQAASQQALAETLTKAITSDPSIRSVIAAAISTMVAGGSNQAAIDSRGENLGQNMKWAEHVQVLNSSTLASNRKGCASSFLNQSTSLNSQPGSLTLQQPPLAFSTSNSSSRSTVDNRDQTN